MEPALLVMTEKAIAEREARRLRKRREDYEWDRARGVPLPMPRRPPSFLGL